MSARPARIGLTTYLQQATWGVWDTQAAVLHASYVDAVADSGGTPILLPPVGTDPDVLNVLDGLIVVGGADVGPEHYGQEAHERTLAHPGRDEHDLTLTQAALERELPLFAICRGVQILNVGLGGTLHQHIPELLGHTDYQPAPGVFGSVEVETKPGSIVHGIVGDRVTEPCYHHQAIDHVADELVVTGWSADGLVQVVETAAPGWVLGVQFHPEQNREDRRLFEAHVEASLQRRAELRGAPA